MVCAGRRFRCRCSRRADHQRRAERAIGNLPGTHPFGHSVPGRIADVSGSPGCRTGCGRPAVPVPTDRDGALPRPQAHSSSKTTSCADCHTSKDLPRAFSKTMTTAAWSTSPRRPRRPHQLARGSSDRPRPGRAACARAAGSGQYVRFPSPPRSHARPGDRARSASPSGA
jgi:hypothetical protein